MRSGRWARRLRGELAIGIEVGQRLDRHRPAHRLAEPRLVPGRHVPWLLLVRRHLGALVEERLVDQLGRDAGHAGAEHAGHRQRVVRVAAEHLEQVGERGVLVLVVVEGADPGVGVAQAGAHALAHHEALPEWAERLREHVGGVAPSPCREPLAERGIAEPGVVVAHVSPPRVRGHPPMPSDRYCSQSQGSRLQAGTQRRACRSCPSGCAGSRRRSGSPWGTCSPASDSRHHAIEWLGIVGARPAASCTRATSRSPISWSGRPTQATSATSGWRASTCSTSAGIDVDAARHDHVGEAVGDEHEPVVVDVADLAEREHARGEVGVGGLLRVALVDDAAARWCRGSTAGPRCSAGSSLPSSSTTSASNGGTARPTEPGWASQSVELIEHTVPDSVPPYDSDSTGPHHSIIARLTSIGHLPPGVGDLPQRRHVVAVANVVRAGRGSARSGWAP